MGLTFLAAGSCTPEALSSILSIRKGERGVGVSNSLGSSTLDIFLTLGVPWFVRNLLQWFAGNERPAVHFESQRIKWTILLLLITVIILYSVLSIAKYRLSRITGLFLFASYLVLIFVSISFEMNLFVTLVSG